MKNHRLILRGPSTLYVQDAKSDRYKVEKITIQENGEGNKPEGVQEMLEVQSYGEDTDAERNAEIIGLKALISSKNERIATLRTVLKANKHTAESGKQLMIHES